MGHNWTEQKVFFVDFEGSRTSGILEYGVVTVLGGQVVESCTRLCRATGRVRAEDSAVHGLQEEALAVHAPFAAMKKSELVTMGVELGVDFSRTWSCYRGGEKACGSCPTCVERRNAFREAGVAEA